MAEERRREWEGFREHKPSNQDAYEEMLNLSEEGAVGIARVLRRLGANEFIRAYQLPAKHTDTSTFQRVLEGLRMEGVDVGKGSCEYGYRMPLPENGDLHRYLIVFRRMVVE